MFKFIRILLGTVITLIITVILAAIILINWVDPNHFKTPIGEQLSKAMGREVKLTGDMRWRFYPNLGLTLNDVQIDNPKTFKTPVFAKASHLDLHIRLLPLIEGKLLINKIHLKDLHLNLIVNKNGERNWTFEKKKAPASQKTSEPVTNKSNSRLKLQEISVAKVHITNANIQYIDKQKNQRYHIKQFNFKSERVASNKPFPIELSSNFQANQPKISGKLSLSGKLTVSEDLATIDLVTDDLKIIADDTTIKGKAHYTNQPNKKSRFDLNINKIDLNRYIDHKTTQGASSRQASTHQGSPQTLPLDMLRALNVEGKLSVNTLRYKEITASRINANINANKGLIKLSPLTSYVFGGVSQANVILNARGQVATITINEELSNIQLAQLLQNKKLSGSGNVKVNIKTQGRDMRALEPNANGVINLAMSNGRIHGIDISHSIKTAAAFFKKQPPPQQDRSYTNFGNVRGTFHLNNRIIKTNDFTADTNAYRITAKGNANLATKRLDFDLLVKLIGSDIKGNILELHNLMGGGIPLSVTGTFEDYKVTPDFKAIVTAVPKLLIKEGAERLLKKPLGEEPAK